MMMVTMVNVWRIVAMVDMWRMATICLLVLISCHTTIINSQSPNHTNLINCQVACSRYQSVKETQAELPFPSVTKHLTNSKNVNLRLFEHQDVRKTLTTPSLRTREMRKS